MARKARAGHVCGGRLFGYENVDVVGLDGKRSHVERKANETEAAIVRRVFELSAESYAAKSIAKRLNAEGILSPRAIREAAVLGAVVCPRSPRQRPVSRHLDLEQVAEAEQVGAEASGGASGV
jgi:hypothetical protein